MSLGCVTKTDEGLRTAGLQSSQFNLFYNILTKGKSNVPKEDSTYWKVAFVSMHLNKYCTVFSCLYLTANQKRFDHSLHAMFVELWLRWTMKSNIHGKVLNSFYENPFI